MQPQLQEAYGVLKMTTPLRDQLLDLFDDSELAYHLDSNPSVGEVFKRLAETQQSYINSFKTFKQDFSERIDDDTLAQSVEKLKTTFTNLDGQLAAALEAITDEQFKDQLIERGFPMSIGAQLHTFREAILIDCAKLTVYVRAMGKPVPQMAQDWLG